MISQAETSVSSESNEPSRETKVDAIKQGV